MRLRIVLAAPPDTAGARARPPFPDAPHLPERLHLPGLPHLSDRNFLVAADLEHHVVRSGPTAASAGTLASPPLAERLLRSDDLWRDDLWRDAEPLAVTPDASPEHTADTRPRTAWRAAVAGEPALLLAARPVVEPTAPIVLVVDGSARMAEAELDWRDLLAAVPDGVELGIVVARADARVLAPLTPLDHRRRRGFERTLRGIDFRGGESPVPGLVQALALVRERPGARVVWLHAPATPALGAAGPVRAALAAVPGGVSLTSFAAVEGIHWLVDELAGSPRVQVGARSHDVTTDLARLLATGTEPGFTVAEVSDPAALAEVPPATPAWAAVARGHWVADQVALGHGERAAQVAAAARLVTPATGAVVLETAAQYAEAGLEPAPPPSVHGALPSVPEPATWALLTVAAGAVARGARRRSA